MRFLSIEQMVNIAKHNREVYMYGGKDCICQWCSTEFTSKKRTLQKYCCNSCRVMAHNDRKINWEEYSDEQYEELAVK